MVGIEFVGFRLEFVEFRLSSAEFMFMSAFMLDFAFTLKVKGEAKFLSLSLSLSRLHCFESLSFGRFG